MSAQWTIQDIEADIERLRLAYLAAIQKLGLVPTALFDSQAHSIIFTSRFDPMERIDLLASRYELIRSERGADTILKFSHEFEDALTWLINDAKENQN